MMNTMDGIDLKKRPHALDLHFIELSYYNMAYFKNILGQRTKYDEEKWVIIAKDFMSIANLTEDLTDATMDLDDEFYFFVSDSKRDSQIETIFELYKISKNSQTIQFNEVGDWSHRNGLNWTTVHKLDRRYVKLEGYLLGYSRLSRICSFQPFLVR